MSVAEEVAGASLDTLYALAVEQLVRGTGGRIVMLETLRQYALARSSSAEGDAARGRAATAGVAWLRARRVRRSGMRDANCLSAIEIERPNLVASLAWALEGGRPELASALVDGLAELWITTHRREEDATGSTPC